MLSLSHVVLQALETHAKSAPEREVCGFVYPSAYVPLRNLSPDRFRFDADPRDVARTLSRHGEPAAVFHTHPNGLSDPSPADLELSYYLHSMILIGFLRPGQELQLAWHDPPPGR